MTKKGKHTVLFICLGNICRSPAAEGIMKSLVEKAGVQDEFEIDSAGIGSWHIGQLPDSRMRKCGAEHGYNFNSHARQFQKSDFARFEEIIVVQAAEETNLCNDVIAHLTSLLTDKLVVKGDVVCQTLVCPVGTY